MLHAVGGERSALPTGLVFASFMLAMSLGGLLFGLLVPLVPGGAQTLCIAVYLLSALAMAVPAGSFSFVAVYVSFLTLEAMVGMFNSCGAALRSRFYPEAQQSTLMSLFRLPLNLLVVAGTLLTSRAGSVLELQRVFALVSATLAGATVLQLAVALLATTTDPATETVTTAGAGAGAGASDGRKESHAKKID